MITDEQLTDKLTELIRVYETSGNAKTKYNAEHEACRIANRLNMCGNEGGVLMLFNNYVAYCLGTEKYDGFRIPKLTKVDLKSVERIPVSTVNLKDVSKDLLQHLFGGRRDYSLPSAQYINDELNRVPPQTAKITYEESLKRIHDAGFKSHLSFISDEEIYKEIDKLVSELEGRARGVNNKPNKR